MPANTKQAVETSPTGKTIITAMNHLSEYNFLEDLNLAHRNITMQSKDIPSKISAGINVLILTVALGTMRHGADLVNFLHHFLLILFLNAVRWDYNLL